MALEVERLRDRLSFRFGRERRHGPFNPAAQSGKSIIPLDSFGMEIQSTPQTGAPSANSALEYTSFTSS